MSDAGESSEDADFQLILVDMSSDEAKPARQPRRDLDLRELSAWSRRQVRHIAASRQVDRGSLNLLLAQTVKLGEEVGELYAEVLGTSQMQRASKSGRFTEETLRDEIADVLICTAILADLLGVDLTQAARTKMATIDNRVADREHQA